MIDPDLLDDELDRADHTLTEAGTLLDQAITDGEPASATAAPAALLALVAELRLSRLLLIDAIDRHAARVSKR